MKLLYFTVIFLLITLTGFSQIGGTNTYEFLNFNTSPQTAARGGELVSHPAVDLGGTFTNPALLSVSLRNQTTLNYVDYVSGVKYGYVAYCHGIKDKFTASYGIHYINYGTFTGADESGVQTGTFQAAEYAFNIAVAMNLDERFTVGADIRPIISSLESYNSFGISTDLGVYYLLGEKRSSMALVFRNMGTEIKSYNGTMETLPFEIQFGYTQYLEHAPFNFTITAQHLENWNMSINYDKTNNSEVVSYQNEESSRTLDKIAKQAMMHLVFGTEFTPFKNFYLRLGYNYERRQEMKISTRPATAGISWGIGMTIKKLHFSYARATYSLAGASDHISITTDLKSFKKTKNN